MDILKEAQEAALQGEMLSREYDVDLYQWSADRGDFKTMHEILTRAEQDPELAVMITAINRFTVEDIPQLEEASHQAQTLVQHILEHYQNKNPERLGK
jgi:hypothetical protein